MSLDPRTRLWIAHGLMTRDGLGLTERGEAEAERLHCCDDIGDDDYPSPGGHGWAPDLPEDRYAA